MTRLLTAGPHVPVAMALVLIAALIFTPARTSEPTPIAEESTTA